MTSYGDGEGIVSLTKDGQRHVKRITYLLSITWYPPGHCISTPKQFRILRRQIGWTRPQLAEYLGVATRTIRSWETDEGKQNHRGIPIEMFLKLKSLHEELYK